VTAPNLSTIADAKRMIDDLIDRGGFVEYNKKQYAVVMDWYLHGEPDVARVQRACNCTRDQLRDPELAEAFAGFVVAYSPVQGGMTLIDPTGDLPLDHGLHVCLGDVRAQQQSKTQNQRRLPTWKQMGAQAMSQHEPDIARVCWQIEGEISSTGFASNTSVAEFMKLCRLRGFE
jgi:hypothetical protein